MKLTKEQVEELVWGGEVPGLDVVTEESRGTRRWSETRRLVFSDGKQLWAFDYEKGLTEQQETDLTVTEAFRVEAVAVTSVRYDRVKA